MAPAGTVPAQGDRALLVLTDLGASDPELWRGRSYLIPWQVFCWAVSQASTSLTLESLRNALDPLRQELWASPLSAMVPS